MQTFKLPPESEWKKILARPVFDASELEQKVKAILNEVRTEGDTAVKKYTALFDGIELNSLVVSENEISEAEKKISNWSTNFLIMSRNRVSFGFMCLSKSAGDIPVSLSK